MGSLDVARKYLSTQVWSLDLWHRSIERQVHSKTNMFLCSTSTPPMTDQLLQHFCESKFRTSKCQSSWQLRVSGLHIAITARQHPLSIAPPATLSFVCSSCCIFVNAVQSICSVRIERNIFKVDGHYVHHPVDLHIFVRAALEIVLAYTNDRRLSTETEFEDE